MTISKIIIRVYGIWIDGDNQVLLSDELHNGLRMTKFPGGGLEPGEGPIDSLRREWMEELGVEIDILDHFYTTDFFQQSAFHDDAQILSIYYRIVPRGVVNVDVNANSQEEEIEVFRKVGLNELSVEDVTFPIDKRVVALIKML